MIDFRLSTKPAQLATERRSMALENASAARRYTGWIAAQLGAIADQMAQMEAEPAPFITMAWCNAGRLAMDHEAEMAQLTREAFQRAAEARV